MDRLGIIHRDVFKGQKLKEYRHSWLTGCRRESNQKGLSSCLIPNLGTMGVYIRPFQLFSCFFVDFEYYSIRCFLEIHWYHH